MKKLWIVIALVLMMCGCAVPTFETVGDVYAPQQEMQPKKIEFSIPKDAAAQVMENESSRIYFCDGYEIMLDTLHAGDLNKTIQVLTGYAADALTVMETSVSQMVRYECVWTAAGEAGDQVGRAVILDDGSYHYCMSVMASAQEAGSLQNSWEELLQTFRIQD